MQELAASRTVTEAMTVLKEMQLQQPELAPVHELGRAALKEVLEDRMRDKVRQYLEDLSRRGESDRRNGTFRRWLLTAMGALELWIPRTRRFSPVGMVRAFARRERHVDGLILACFVLGLSTRKVGQALLTILGERISPSTVSRVASQLDTAVVAFHGRPLANRYRVLVLDGVVLARRTGAGAVRRPVLVALGITNDGRREVLDFRLVRAESQSAWETFLTDLRVRGLTGEGLALIAADGGAGLLAALPVVYPNVRVQRCWAHKTRNGSTRSAGPTATRSSATCTASVTPPTATRPAPWPGAWSIAGIAATRLRSAAWPWISTNCSRSSSSTMNTGARPPARPTPSSAASGRSDAAPDPWA